MKPRMEINLEEVEKLAQVCDNEEEIARALGISIRTLRNRKKDLAGFAEAIKTGKAKANVFVGGKLMKLIQEGNVAATIFWLKARAGWKETQRQELTGNEGGAVKIESASPDLNKIPADKLLKIEEILYGKEVEEPVKKGND